MVFGDVMIYLTELADKLGIDPLEATKAKVAINGQRCPAELVKGRAAKYTEFRYNSHPSTCRVGDTGVGLLASFG